MKQLVVSLLLVGCAPATEVTARVGALGDVGPVVTLSADMAVEGVANDGVNEWRGIPYAAAPVGERRWHPPAPAEPWTGVRPAKEFASPCIQPRWDDAGVPFTIGSEDCLYLNVFAPEGASGAPVMVHLHGGGNTFGEALQEASAFVGRGAVVVTLNYRLGVLGFAGHPALTAEGRWPEQGILDQLAALRWVKQHIAAFGGDPERVTLFGFSAGSFDAMTILVSPLRGDLVHRAIIPQTVYFPFHGNSPLLADSEAIGLDVAAQVGCADAADVPGCLRATPAAALVVAAGGMDIGFPVGGTVLPASPRELAPGVDLPVLVGANREDDASFWYFDPLFPAEGFTTGDYVLLADDLFDVKAGQEARKVHYRVEDYPSVWRAFITMQTDAIHLCPARELAHALGGPTWRFLTTHHLENDPLGAAFGADHGMTELLSWADWTWYSNPSASELELSRTVVSYWTNFATSGDPNLPQEVPFWPRHDLDRAAEPYQVFGVPVRSDAGYHARQCDWVSTQVPYAACGAVCKAYFEKPFGHFKSNWGLPKGGPNAP